MIKMDQTLSLAEVLFCGFLGGFVADGLELQRIVKANGGEWPSEWRRSAFWLAELIRMISGVGVAWVFWRSGQINGSLGALVIGATTPLIMEKFSRSVAAHVFGMGIGEIYERPEPSKEGPLLIKREEVVCRESESGVPADEKVGHS
jgi:hypothetical protein